ncbi:MAG: carboxypeptidase-like regulatory domain-containing protein [Bacteroidales bacterium]
MPFAWNRLLLIGILAAMFLLASGQVDSQEPPRRVIQFTGLVLTSDSLEPLPYASVWVKNTNRGTTTDHYGFFSIPVFDDDTLRFSSVGYRDKFYAIPDTLTQSRYSAVQMMTKDTIHLSETVVYPWPTRAQFRHAFIHTDVPSDDYDRAMRNLAQAELRERMEHMPMDGSMNFKHYVQQQANRRYHAGQAPPVRLFDPMAWVEFFQAWRDGKFRRDD